MPKGDRILGYWRSLRVETRLTAALLLENALTSWKIQTTRSGFLSSGFLDYAKPVYYRLANCYVSTQTRKSTFFQYVCGFTDSTSESNHLPQVCRKTFNIVQRLQPLLHKYCVSKMYLKSTPEGAGFKPNSER